MNTRAVTPTGCRIFSARGIFSSRCRTKASKSKAASIAISCTLSRETGIPLVATNDCHYLTQSDSHAQEVLMCIQTGKTMSDAQRMKFATDQFYFKTAEEMAQVFHEIADAVSRTVKIAERCNVKNPARRQSISRIQGSRRPYDRFVFRESGARRIQSRARFSSSGWRAKIACAIR